MQFSWLKDTKEHRYDNETPQEREATQFCSSAFDAQVFFLPEKAARLLASFTTSHIGSLCWQLKGFFLGEAVWRQGDPPIHYHKVVAKPGIYLHFDRVGFDPINGRRTGFGQHGSSYAPAGREALSGNENLRAWQADTSSACGYGIANSGASLTSPEFRVRAVY